MRIGSQVVYTGTIAKIRGRVGRVVPLRCEQNRENWVSVSFGRDGIYDLKGANVQPYNGLASDRAERDAERRALGGEA